jgi:uncharacterized glyoxalase superfamily protein PhnB
MSSTPEPLVGKSLQASLTVKDLQKSVTWYVDVVGFTADRRIERDGTLRAVAVSAGDVRIILNQDDGAKGWDRIEPKDMPWGVRIFRVRDPDGFRWTISAPHAA